MSRRRVGMKLSPDLEAKARAILMAQDADTDMAQLEREALASVGKRDTKPGKCGLVSVATGKPLTCSRRRMHPGEHSWAKRARKAGEPSKVERLYAAHLDALQAAGEVVAYEPQPAAINLAHGVSYTADFKVGYVDASMAYVECKGAKVGKRGKSRPFFHDDGARIKVRVAARRLADGGVRLVLAWRDPKTKAWLHEVVPA